MRLIKAMALLVPLLPAAGGLAQAPQGADRTPEGNLGSGAAMSGAQSQSMGTPPAAGATVPPQPTHSPTPPGGTGTGTGNAPAR